MERTADYTIIIADTSGLVSLFSPVDTNHAAAVDAAKRLLDQRTDVIVPASVYVEFLNVMGRKVGHATAAAAVAELAAPFIVQPDLGLVQTQALVKFTALPEAVSFTDCLVMAMADTYQTREIFGFDKQFSAAGYQRLTPAANDLPDAA